MNPTPIHPKLAEITERIIERSRPTREKYLAKIRSAKQMGRLERNQLGCSNLAHGYAAMPKKHQKSKCFRKPSPNFRHHHCLQRHVSAHQPFKDFPDQIKDEAQKNGATAQVAGGTPAMCDGITQGYAGMELSLFSRDVIAMSTAIGLSHQMFDGSLFMGVCDKIVPGLMIGALSFGHIPGIFVPAGPMSSGIGNKEKARTRQLSQKVKSAAMPCLKRNGLLPQPGYLYLLRYRQLQPNDDGNDGRTPACRRLCPPLYRPARSPDPLRRRTPRARHQKRHHQTIG